MSVNKTANGAGPVKNGTIDQTNPEDVAALFQKIGDLEKTFADVELDALRRKEHALTPLYGARAALLSQIPGFWPTVFLNAPEEIQQLYGPEDVGVLSAIKDFRVERYQISSDDSGEPRSLRFVFEFEQNEFFEDKIVTKDFEYQPGEDGGPGNLVSKAVGLKWKKSKKDLTEGLLGAAVDLEGAEGALGVKDVEAGEREGLWQYEKLREKIEAVEEEGREGSFWSWLGFRGAVGSRDNKKAANGDAEDEDESDDEDDGMLDVEIFPAGEEVAITLAEELWPGVMDYFMRAQEDPEDLEDFDGFDSDDAELIDGEEAPELVLEEEVEVKDERPTKKQRTG